ncbi:MAG TPA: hypothetical protein VLL08_32560 [Kineosporiaceae bacterium]|nr:hypothetical protein [Kineosporiaceae bacterium]
MKLGSIDYRIGRPRADRLDADDLLNRAFRWSLSAKQRISARVFDVNPERGDVSGWVLVTLMTAGLVVTLWAVAGPRLEEVFNDAMDRVVGGP